MFLTRFIVRRLEAEVMVLSSVQAATVQVPFNDTPTLDLTVNLNTPQSPSRQEVLSWIDNCDISMESCNGAGSPWVEGRGCRWMLTRDSSDKMADDNSIRLTGIGVDMDLDSTFSMRPSKYSNEGVRTFTNVTPGAAMRQLMEEARADGMAQALTWKFSDANDSFGASWQTVIPELKVDMASSYKEILTNLNEMGYVNWAFQGNELQLSRTPDGAMTTHVSTEVTYGREITDGPTDRDASGGVDMVQVRGARGLTHIGKRPTTRPRGARATAVMESGIGRLGSAIAAANKILNKRPQLVGELTRHLVFSEGAKSFPFVGYQVGQTIWTTGPEGTMEILRIHQVTLQISGERDGLVSGHLLLGGRFVAPQVAQGRAIAAIKSGTVIADAGTGGTAPPPTGTLTPAAVTSFNAIVSPSSYGPSQVDIQMYWGAVTKATTGAALNVETYTIERSTPTGWLFVDETSGIVSSANGVASTTSYKFRIRAKALGVYGAWAEFTITPPADSGAPPVPSKPIVSQSTGVVEVSWDGRTSTGSYEWPADFTYVVVEYTRSTGGDSGSFIFRPGSQRGQIFGETPGTILTFQARSRDADKNWSAWTPPVSITVADGLVDLTSLNQALADAGKTATAPATSTILDGSITAEAVWANGVSAYGITSQSILADKATLATADIGSVRTNGLQVDGLTSLISASAALIDFGTSSTSTRVSAADGIQMWRTDRDGVRREIMRLHPADQGHMPLTRFNGRGRAGDEYDYDVLINPPFIQFESRNGVGYGAGFGYVQDARRTVVSAMNVNGNLGSVGFDANNLFANALHLNFDPGKSGRSESSITTADVSSPIGRFESIQARPGKGSPQYLGLSTTTSAANTHLDGNWRLFKSSSARRFKRNIEDSSETMDPFAILDVPARTWIDQAQWEGHQRYLADGYEATPSGEWDEFAKLRRVGGVVAEEVRDAGLDTFVTYNLDGEVEGVAYDRLWTVLIPVVRNLRDRIAHLESELGVTHE